VRITGYVPFEDLPAIYSLAEMFVFPSVYEGFGLPVIEAMACGTPAIVADVPALTEVSGGAAVHVPTLDAEALGEALVALATSAEMRAEVSQRGLERAAAFSWRRAALETLAVYRQVASRRGATAPAFTPVTAEPSSQPGPPAAAARGSQRQ
jgi:glycosyltransferase involved in cell wall biosynthesis